MKGSSILKEKFNLNSFYRMSIINLVLLIITGIAGLFIPGTYEKFIEPLHLAESQGQDFTTLFIGIPLLIAGMKRTRKGLADGIILWSGASGYFLYIYIIYSYGGVYNILFPLYTAVCGLSLFILIGLLYGIDIQKAVENINTGQTVKPAAVYFIITALILILMWGGMAADSIANGNTADANVIIVTDFIIIIPAFLIAAFRLIKKNIWGSILSGILFTQAVTLGVSITAGQIIAYIKGSEPVWGLAAFFLLFTMTGLLIGIPFIKNFEKPAAG